MFMCPSVHLPKRVNMGSKGLREPEIGLVWLVGSYGGSQRAFEVRILFVPVALHRITKMYMYSGTCVSLTVFCLSALSVGL